jgi:hypothetical protein
MLYFSSIGWLDLSDRLNFSRLTPPAQFSNQQQAASQHLVLIQPLAHFRGSRFSLQQWLTHQQKAAPPGYRLKRGAIAYRLPIAN